MNEIKNFLIDLTGEIILVGLDDRAKSWPAWNWLFPIAGITSSR